jgi:hypothetical protein
MSDYLGKSFDRTLKVIYLFGIAIVVFVFGVTFFVGWKMGQKYAYKDSPDPYMVRCSFCGFWNHVSASESLTARQPQPTTQEPQQ